MISSSSTTEQKVGKVTKELKLANSIKNHLGILEDVTFNINLSSRDQEMIGLRMQSLLSGVADGALVPLLHFTLSSGHILKLAALKEHLISPEMGFGM